MESSRYEILRLPIQVQGTLRQAIVEAKRIQLQTMENPYSPEEVVGPFTPEIIFLLDSIQDHEQLMGVAYHVWETIKDYPQIQLDWSEAPYNSLYAQYNPNGIAPKTRVDMQFGIPVNVPAKGGLKYGVALMRHIGVTEKSFLDAADTFLSHMNKQNPELALTF